MTRISPRNHRQDTEQEIRRLQARLDAAERDLASARKSLQLAGSDALSNDEALRRMAERRAILYRASNEINASLNSEEVYVAIYHAVEQVMPCEDFVLSLYSDEKNLIIGKFLVENGKIIQAFSYIADHGLAVMLCTA